MKPQNYVVSLTVGGATRSRTWNTENELAIGHPIRWVLERSGSGLHIRNVASGAVTEVTERELQSGDFIDLPEKGGKSGFSLRLRALETLPAAYKTHEGEGELRVYTVRGAWTSAAETVEGKYVGRADGHRVFTLTRENDQFWIRAHEEGLELAPSRGAAQSIPKGEEVLFKAKAIAGRSLTFGETTWRLDTLAPVAAPEMVEGFEAEDASFQRTLRATLA
ncbi:MAG TPA: hypothetical protein VM598_08995, partial [Bdellovibrionota bacterium]|nr:hypothetical protein [Bdellovibrionota bacterium]